MVVFGWYLEMRIDGRSVVGWGCSFYGFVDVGGKSRVLWNVGGVDGSGVIVRFV